MQSKVQISKLISKLIDKNVNKYLTNTIMSMLSNTHVNVNFNNTKGATWKLNNGTRQGGILSPYLFSLYINEMLDDIADEGTGCSLNNYQTNILAYADDITLIAPTSSALQKLLNKLFYYISELGLKLNVNKSVYMVCKAKLYKHRNFENCVKLNGSPLQLVDHYKYLGIIISENNTNYLDIKRCCKSFLGQFYSMYRNFNNVHKDLLIFLFNSYCTSFYGIELWHSKTFCASEYHNQEVIYHKSIKKMLKVSFRESNHAVCLETALPIFRHFHNWRMISFYFNISRSKSPCVVPLKNYLLNNSNFSSNIREIFDSIYSIQNLLDNDLDAIKSRIVYVQNHEPNSMEHNIVDER